MKADNAETTLSRPASSSGSADRAGPHKRRRHWLNPHPGARRPSPVRGLVKLWCKERELSRGREPPKAGWLRSPADRPLGFPATVQEMACTDPSVPALTAASVGSVFVGCLGAPA